MVLSTHQNINQDTEREETMEIKSEMTVEEVTTSFK